MERARQEVVSSVTCRHRLPFRHRPSRPTPIYPPPLIITTIEPGQWQSLVVPVVEACEGGREGSGESGRTRGRGFQFNGGQRGRQGQRGVERVTRRPCHVRFQLQPTLHLVHPACQLHQLPATPISSFLAQRPTTTTPPSQSSFSLSMSVHVSRQPLLHVAGQLHQRDVAAPCMLTIATSHINIHNSTLYICAKGSLTNIANFFLDTLHPNSKNCRSFNVCYTLMAMVWEILPPRDRISCTVS